MMSPQVAQGLAPVATRLGLRAVGTAPLMVLRAGTPVPVSRPVKVTRALGDELVNIVVKPAAGVDAARV